MIGAFQCIPLSKNKQVAEFVHYRFHCCLFPERGDSWYALQNPEIEHHRAPTEIGVTNECAEFEI